MLSGGDVPAAADAPAHSLTVAERLELMAAAVRKGAFDEATAIGNASSPPLAVPQSSLEPLAVISEGPNSTVRAATMTADGEKLKVAVKRVALRRPADGAAFRAEVSALARVAAVHSASGNREPLRVARLVGARALPPDFLVVTPLCPLGSAADALERKRRRGDDESSRSPCPVSSWPGVLRLAGDIASGIASVHAAGLVHRDVKPENVLLDEQGRGVLCDLGVAIDDDVGENDDGDAMEEDGGRAPPSTSSSSPSRKRSHATASSSSSVPSDDNGRNRNDPLPTKPSGGHSRRHMVGTLEYMPPEVLLGHSRATRAADVYAWAIASNALATGTTPPFRDCDKPTAACHTVLEFGYGRQELAAAVAAGGLRPRDASGVRMRASGFGPSDPSSPPPRVLVPAPPRFLSLIEKCWSADPGERPSAAEVAAECREIEEEVVAEERRLAAEAGAKAAAPNGAAMGEKDPALADGGSAAAALLDGVGLDSSDDEGDEGGRGRPWPLPGWARTDPSPPPYLPRVSAASFEAIGRRESMEDAVLSASPLHPRGEGGASSSVPSHLFAVFDGHRGAGAARYAARSLQRHLRSVWESSRSPGEALERAFERCDARWKRREAAALARDGGVSVGGEGGGERRGEDRQSRQKRHCGAAATAALIWGDTLTVANVGDCRGLLAVVDDEGGGEGDGDGTDGAEGRQKPPSWRSLRLTADHSADDPAERARVASEGGTLIPPPGAGETEKGWRLGPVGLAVTRALGDADVPGCSCRPHVFTRELDRSCVALILVSDGVTEALEARSGDAAVGVGAARATSTASGGRRPTPRSLAVDAEVAALVADTVKEPAMAARRLVVEAVEHRGGKDNAAALVAYLTPVESLERVF